jgi:hypothetical protein
VNSVWRSGAWRVLGERERFEEARPALEEVLRGGRSERGLRPLGPCMAYFKGSPLRTRPALRHALRRIAGCEHPRLQEFRNLEWLQAHGFQAARPLLAGVRVRGGLARYQFLFTEFRADEPALDQWLPSAIPELRAACLASLARDVARLHRLGFVHRDLFPRNLLVCATGPSCVFLDAWRGGAGHGLRGPEHDLGCLFLDGAGLFTVREQLLFLDTYRAESQRLGRFLPPPWLEQVERARRRVFRRESRRRSGLVPEWRIPTSGVKPAPSLGD